MRGMIGEQEISQNADATRGPITPRASIGYWLIIAIIAAVGIGKAVRSDGIDPDCFWHLCVAKQLLKEGVHPIVDHLSYASIKTPWTPYSWLAELGMKWAWDAGGFRLTIVIQCAAAIATIFIIGMACETLAGRRRRMCCATAMIYFAYLLLPFLSFRPVTFAIVLMALIAWLLLRDRAREEKTLAVWWTVPITALIVNVHLTAIVVPMWVGALLIGAAWEQARGHGDAKRTRRYGLLLAGTIAACMATPLLPGVIATAWHYQAQDVMVASNVITEMQPVWRGGMAPITLTLMALVFVFAIWNRKRLRAGEWIWLVIGALLMLRLGRFAPLFGMIAAPIAALTMPTLSDRPLEKPILQGFLTAALAGLLAFIVWNFPNRNISMCDWMTRDYLPVRFPCKAADYVEANVPIGAGRLINEFNWGGYLEWRLGPTYQTLMDGRTQLFSSSFWEQTLLAPNDAARAKFLREQHADMAILPAGKSSLRGAVKRMGWKSVYRDDVAEVYVP